MMLAAAGIAEMTPDDERCLMLLFAVVNSVCPFFLLQVASHSVTIAGGIQFLVYCCAAGAVIHSCDDHEWVWPLGILGLFAIAPITFIVGGWFLALLPLVALLVIALIVTGLQTPETSRNTKVKLVVVPIGYLLLNVASNSLIGATL